MVNLHKDTFYNGEKVWEVLPLSWIKRISYYGNPHIDLEYAPFLADREAAHPFSFYTVSWLVHVHSYHRQIIYEGGIGRRTASLFYYYYFNMFFIGVPPEYDARRRDPHGI